MVLPGQIQQKTTRSSLISNLDQSLARISPACSKFLNSSSSSALLLLLSKWVPKWSSRRITPLKSLLKLDILLGGTSSRCICDYKIPIKIALIEIIYYTVDSVCIHRVSSWPPLTVTIVILFSLELLSWKLLISSGKERTLFISQRWRKV